MLKTEKCSCRRYNRCLKEVFRALRKRLKIWMMNQTSVSKRRRRRMMSLVIKGYGLKRSCEESRGGGGFLKLEKVQKDLQEKRSKL